MAANRRSPERLATLEASYTELKADVVEIKTDVKTLLAAYNRQSGAAKLKAALWTSIVGMAAGAGGLFAGRGH